MLFGVSIHRVHRFSILDLIGLSPVLMSLPTNFAGQRFKKFLTLPEYYRQRANIASSFFAASVSDDRITSQRGMR